MGLSFVVFLITGWAAFSGSLAIRSVIIPKESSTSYVEMIPQKSPFTLGAFTLCMRVATELTGAREIILFAYRTQYFDELNLWREKDGRLSLYLSTDPVFFQVPEFGPLQNHLCLTWNSQSGAAAIFINGRKSLTKIYQKGHTVRAGGRIILGQDPDTFLGGFEAHQSFVGDISDVNMWDSVLSDTMIQNLFNGRREQVPNVLNWETVELRQEGEVQVINVDP
ncbi:PREDICTED: pentraxin fusion protein-like [Cyprinodon variegatus]|nr:PREDICTED: pentraxin fusion protein-like [Cyprinodon variegatus]XP_015234892.1 PREDICTED: pentraxin fusion protein-like [Cyprinodon variegatus]XP_015234893.1 PREDICTED: pentraxin fusion protein-like [Cyprinodon variegatus]